MGRPHNIAYFCSTTIMGGTERMALTFLSRCDRRLFAPHLITLLGRGPLVQEALSHKIPCHALDWRGNYDGRALREFREFLRVHRIGLIHNFGLRAELLCRPLARFCGVRRIVSGIRDIGVWRKWYHVKADQLTARFVDLFIANSRRARDCAIAREKFPADNIRVIHNGLLLPSEHFNREYIAARYNLPGGRSPVLVHVANLRPGTKGHDLLFAALAELRGEWPELLALCVGQDLSRGAIPQRAVELELEEHVRFLGYCEDVYEPLRLADVAVLPSRHESLPVAVLEAMALYLPVVAADVGGVGEIIEDGKNGLLFPAGDHQALAARLRELFRNPELRGRLGGAARRTVEEQFTAEIMTDALQQTYLELLEK